MRKTAIWSTVIIVALLLYAVFTIFFVVVLREVADRRQIETPPPLPATATPTLPVTPTRPAPPRPTAPPPRQPRPLP